MSLLKPEQLLDSIGAYKTQSLFYETSKSLDKYDPLMTLTEYDKEYNGKTLPSLRKMYMEIADPTEYEFAMEVFGSWKCWEKICGNKLIMGYVQGWRDELEVKLRSQAVKSLIDTASSEGAKGTTAAKYIAEKGWIKRKAGAPTKEEKQKELAVSTKIDKEIEEDIKRMSVH